MNISYKLRLEILWDLLYCKKILVVYNSIEILLISKIWIFIRYISACLIMHCMLLFLLLKESFCVIMDNTGGTLYEKEIQIYSASLIM